jgi:hypothetical protein
VGLLADDALAPELALAGVQAAPAAANRTVNIPKTFVIGELLSLQSSVETSLAGS